MTTFESTARPGFMFEESTQKWYPIAGRIATGANYIWSGTNNFKNSVLIEDVLNVTFRFNSFLNPAARLATIPSPQIGLLTFVQQDALGATINRFEFWNGTTWTPIADPNAATINGTQTLTNKTLTSPVINGGTLGTGTTITNNATISGGTISSATIDQSTITQFRTTVSFNPQTGVAYTLALTDRDRIVELSNTGAIALTVPTDAAVAFPVGSSVTILQTNTGQVTVSGSGGVTVNGTPGLRLRTQWSVGTLIKRSTNGWVLMGDLSA